tara:strand:- start:741 stop:1103 length:363 start_codon:yes stop_codon:yes gene_type:complete
MSKYKQNSFTINQSAKERLVQQKDKYNMSLGQWLAIIIDLGYMLHESGNLNIQDDIQTKTRWGDRTQMHVRMEEKSFNRLLEIANSYDAPASRILDVLITKFDVKFSIVPANFEVIDGTV